MREADSPRTRRPRATRALASGLALAALALSACGASATSTTEQTTATGPAPTPISPTVSSSTVSSGLAPPPPTPRRGTIQGQTGLAYSTASAQTVQRQPAPGTCHAIGSGLYSRPDPRCTPGALNPAITQADIGQTICQPGWTDTIRPPESVTEPEKAASMAAYDATGPISGYEYDHFVPLELGGAVNDPRNLWPEPGASPNPKDAVEEELNERVCDGQMSLAEAQSAISANWVALAAPPPAPAPTSHTSGSSATSTSSPPAAAAQCTANASYDARYRDYDVDVHSNQPNQAVTVTDAAGRTATWHTDASGTADVYFHAPADAAGETITAHVGSASCRTTL